MKSANRTILVAGMGTFPEVQTETVGACYEITAFSVPHRCGGKWLSKRH